MRRGEIYLANLNPVIGSEQGGTRPVLAIQNDIGNRYSPTTIVAAITSRIRKAKLPTHVEISGARFNLDRDSVVLLEQIRPIDKLRLQERVAELDEESMAKVNEALSISLGLVDI